MKSNSPQWSFEELSPKIPPLKTFGSNHIPAQPTNLPLVFLPSTRKVNYWNEIAYTILRSIHSQDSFAKTSQLNFRQRKLLDPISKTPTLIDSPLLATPLLSEKPLTRDSLGKLEKHDHFQHTISKFSHKSKNLRFFPSDKIKSKKSKEITIRHQSFSFCRENISQDDECSPRPVNLGRRRSCYGKHFGFPTRKQERATNYQFKTQMERKKQVAIVIFG